MIRRILTLGLGVGAILLATQARADTSLCTDRTVLVGRLAAAYGERRQAAGLAGPDQLVELFASPETGSWTITVTTPDGLACLLGVGHHFERFDTAPPQGDPA